MTPDRRFGHRGNPKSLNRYSYVLGDPINHRDRSGLGPEKTVDDGGDCDDDDCPDDPDDPEDDPGGGGSDCGPNWETDASLSGPCCPTTNGNSLYDPTPDPPNPVCYAPQGTPTPSVPKPPCNTDVPKTYTTLGNLGQDVLGITAQKDAAITPADLLALVATLASDIANEMLDPTSFFQGGHFFLDLSLASVAQDFGGSATAAYADFVNLFDPSGNGRRYPDPVPTTDPSHKYYLHDHSVNQNQDLTFHFDRYNPNSNFPVGILGHFGVDVLYGSLGVHCLDPAWRL